MGKTIMANIGELEVGTIKIAYDAFTKFYSLAGSGSSAQITVGEVGPNPLTIYARVPGASSLSMTRSRGSVSLGSQSSLPGPTVLGVFSDAGAQDGDTYILSGVPASAVWELCAVARLR